MRLVLKIIQIKLYSETEEQNREGVLYRCGRVWTQRRRRKTINFSPFFKNLFKNHLSFSVFQFSRGPKWYTLLLMESQFNCQCSIYQTCSSEEEDSDKETYSKRDKEGEHMAWSGSFIYLHSKAPLLDHFNFKTSQLLRPPDYGPKLLLTIQ